MRRSSARSGIVGITFTLAMIVSSQDSNSQGGCVQGGPCKYTYIDYDDEAEHGDGGSSDTGIGSGGGGSGPGGMASGRTAGAASSSKSPYNGPRATTPGVEPNPFPAQAKRFFGGVLGGILGAGRAPTPESRGGSVVVGESTPMPGTSINLVKLAQLRQPTISAPNVRRMVESKPQWDRPYNIEYVDGATQIAQQTVAWAENTGHINDAAKLLSATVGVDGASATGIAALPNRISNNGASTSIRPPPPMFIALSGPPVDRQLRVKESIPEKDNEYIKRAIDVSIERANKTIDRDIATVKAISDKKDFNKYASGAKDVKSIVTGLGKILTTADLAVRVRKVIAADPGKNREYEASKTAFEYASDLAAKAAQQGIGKIAAVLLPETAPYLVAAVDVSVLPASIFFGSEEIGLDPAEIVRDTSGKYSIEEKRKALAEQIKWYGETKVGITLPIEGLLQQIYELAQQQKLPGIGK